MGGGGGGGWEGGGRGARVPHVCYLMLNVKNEKIGDLWLQKHMETGKVTVVAHSYQVELYN